MTDIVEQAARVLKEHQDDNDPIMSRGCLCGSVEDQGTHQAQALADAGLLAEPARTMPTRNEIAEAMHARDDEDVDYLDHESALRYADAVLALLADEVVLKGSVDSQQKVA